jgi:hypothetical protein
MKGWKGQTDLFGIICKDLARTLDHWIHHNRTLPPAPPQTGNTFNLSTSASLQPSSTPTVGVLRGGWKRVGRRDEDAGE